MLSILELQENKRVAKKHFLNAKVYNPWRAKSKLAKEYDKCIMCKRDKWTSYWMYITNPFIARNNMSESDRLQYPLEHLYNAYTS
jgi:hypothetical protein